MSDHPALERILDRALGTGGGSGEIDAHMASCARCREAEAWVLALLAATGRGRPSTAPPDLVDRALAIPAAEPRSRPQRRWSIARLVEDAFARPLLAGVRGSATARRALYEIPGGHVDLEVSPDQEDGERVRITAQVLLDEAETPPDLVAILWRENESVSRAVGDETGTFVLERVEHGVYRLEVLSASAGRAIRIGNLIIETGAVSS